MALSKKEILRRILIPIYTIALLLVLAFEIGAPYMIMHPFKLKQATTAAAMNLNFVPMNIKTSDGIYLRGELVLPEHQAVRGTLIMVHGINGNRSFYFKTAQQLSESGIAVMVFDSRAHGESGGEYCTYGYNEKYDIKTIVDTLQQRLPNVPIGIWGHSLGGAVSLQALEFDKRLSFGIIESTFASLNDIVYDYMKVRFGFKVRFLSNHALHRAGSMANFEPDEVQPIESVKHITQPLFFGHGDQDRNISFEYGKTLFENAVSSEKEFHAIHGAGHNNLGRVGGVAYNAQILAFIEKHILKKV